MFVSIWCLFFFADDTNLFQSGKDVIRQQLEVEADLNRISEWLKINKLSLNIKKTHFIVFTRIRMCLNLIYRLQLMVIKLTKQTTLNYLV